VVDGGARDANRFDAARLDASNETSMGADAAPDDGGAIPRCSPLPDGSGRLTFRTSGGLTLDDHLGNDATCDSSWSQANGLVLSFFVPVPVDAGDNPTGILSARVPNAQLGMVGAGLPAIVDLLIMGQIWESTDMCTATLTGNERVGSGPSYKMTGSVACTSAVPEVFGRPPLTIVEFAFVASVTPN
jgi:hypothetical protein